MKKEKKEKKAEPESNGNQRILRLAKDIYNWNLIDVKDPVQLDKRINKYIDYCEENNIKPGIAGLASAIGITRSALINWANGNINDVNIAVLSARAVGMIKHCYEMYMQESEINPVSGIFLMSNDFEYQQKSINKVETSVNVITQSSEAQLMDRYIDYDGAERAKQIERHIPQDADFSRNDKSE